MNLLAKTKLVSQVFIAGAKSSLDQEWVWGTSAIVGLSQGLKYKGSIKTGISGGLATLAVITGVMGIINVVHNWDELSLKF